jgi:hypothetical protein
MTGSGLSRQTIVAAMLGMVVLAGCSSAKSTSLTTTTVASSGTIRSAVPEDLRSTIFNQLPASYIEEPAGSALDGPLGLTATAEAVDDQETAKQQAILQQYGFRRAYQRAWVVKGTGKMLIIRVQVMGSATQALGYFNLLTFADRVSTQVTTFPTPQLADASGFTRLFTGSTGSQASQDVNLVRGPLFYHFILTGAQGSVAPSDVLSIASSQSTEAATLGYT